MKEYFLAEVETKDHLIHQGIYYHPHTPSKKALLWIHGLTSNFSAHIVLFDRFAGWCEKYGFGFAAFNNRGHDIVTGIKKRDKRIEKGYTRVNGGAGYEVFTDCTYDIDAGISFLASQGYSEIILMGHSTGANKVCFYAGKKRDPRVSGIVLASPVSDRLDPSLDKKDLSKKIGIMRKLVARNRGDEPVSGVHGFLITPKRFLSSFLPGSDEDVFDYGDTGKILSVFRHIPNPVLIILGTSDEYLDRPADLVIRAFSKAAKKGQLSSKIIEGSTHGYTGFENVVVESVVSWVNSF
jgi:pimeloyl-ACP methyl ester carboxylesterase